MLVTHAPSLTQKTLGKISKHASGSARQTGAGPGRGVTLLWVWPTQCDDSTVTIFMETPTTFEILSSKVSVPPNIPARWLCLLIAQPIWLSGEKWNPLDSGVSEYLAHCQAPGDWWWATGPCDTTLWEWDKQLDLNDQVYWESNLCKAIQKWLHEFKYNIVSQYTVNMHMYIVIWTLHSPIFKQILHRSIFNCMANCSHYMLHWNAAEGI